MSDIRAALRAKLLADATVSSLVGASRIYPGILPQGVTAASLVQNLISEQTDYHFQGASGLVSLRVQVDAWAQTQDAAVALAAAVKTALSGFQGVIAYGSSSPQPSIAVQAIYAETARDDYDSTPKMHRRSRDYVVWFEEL